MPTRRALLTGLGGSAAVAAAGVGAALWSMGSESGYREYAARLRAAPPPRPDLADLVRYATLAANGHNTQPWRFRLQARAIAIRPDVSRRTPVVDPDDHHLFVSLGCAAENLMIAARASGRGADLILAEDGREGVVVSLSPGRAAGDPLFDAIPRRQSTRAAYDGRPVPPTDLAALEAAAAAPGVRLVLATARAEIDRIRDLVVAGNSAQMADPAFMRELKSWLRFNPRAAEARGDGLYAAASGSPVLPTVLGGIAFDRFFRPAGENARYVRQLDSSAGVAVFVGDRADPAHWIAVGRACQRFALEATRLGLRCAFVNQPVEVARLRPELAALVGEPGERPDLVMRFGHGPAMPYSPRRPVAAVLE